jgi:hypothetical protein
MANRVLDLISRAKAGMLTSATWRQADAADANNQRRIVCFACGAHNPASDMGQGDDQYLVLGSWWRHAFLCRGRCRQDPCPRCGRRTITASTPAEALEQVIDDRLEVRRPEDDDAPPRSVRP